MSKLEEFLFAHPKIVLALVGLIGLLIEALTGVTVEVGDQVGVG